MKNKLFTLALMSLFSPLVASGATTVFDTSDGDSISVSTGHFITVGGVPEFHMGGNSAPATITVATRNENGGSTFVLPDGDTDFDFSVRIRLPEGGNLTTVSPVFTFAADRNDNGRSSSTEWSNAVVITGTPVDLGVADQTWYDYSFSGTIPENDQVGNPIKNLRMSLVASADCIDCPWCLQEMERTFITNDGPTGVPEPSSALLALLPIFGFIAKRKR